MPASFRATILLGFAASVSIPAIAAAQAITAEAAVAAALPGDGDIIVTAQRREEALVDVPIAITALSADTLDRSGITGLDDLAQVVPGLQSAFGGAYFQPVIRGVSTQIASAGANSNIATYIDGIYRPSGQTFVDFIDLEGVQVLKGPQGTLFGRNATGGAIVITTKEPSFQPAGEFRFGIGSFNQVRAAAYVSSGITDTIAASLTAGVGSSDGWIRNIADGSHANPRKDYSVRAKLLFQPSDTFKLVLTGEQSRVNDPTLYATSPYKGYTNAALFGVPLTYTNPREISQGGDAQNILRSRALSLKGEADLGFATLTSISSGRWDRGYQRSEQLASAYPVDGTTPLPGTTLGSTILNANWQIHTKTYSQEFNLSHSGGPIEWTAGLYYYYDKTAFLPLNVNLYGPFGPGGSYAASGDILAGNYAGINQSYAAFGDVTYNTGNWHFTAGLRYSLDRASIWYESAPGSRLKDATNFNTVTPRAVIRYTLSPDSNIYASWSRGAKSGFYNTSGFLVQGKPVRPEELDAFEVGYKISRPTWQLETSAYYYDYRNLQIATYLGAFSIHQNAPKSRIYGGDIHVRAKLLESLTLDLGAAYTHARYVDFPNASATFFSPTSGILQGSAYLRDVAGNKMVRSPDFTASAGLDYQQPLFGGVAAINANYAYQSRSYFDSTNLLPQSAYGLLNLRAGWTDPSGHLTFAVSGKNVLNEKYRMRLEPGGGSFAQVFGQPASVFFEVRYKY